MLMYANFMLINADDYRHFRILCFLVGFLLLIDVFN